MIEIKNKYNSYKIAKNLLLEKVQAKHHILTITIKILTFAEKKDNGWILYKDSKLLH